MKKYIIALPLLVFVVLFGVPDRLSSQLFRHVSEGNGFALELPANWEVVKGEENIELIALAPDNDPSDLFRENVNVFVSKLESPMNKDEYFALNIKSLQQLLEDFDLEESRNETIDGIEVKKLVFSHTMGIVSAHVVQYLILDQGKVFIVTFTADPIDFKKYRPQFEDMAKSFKIIRATA